MRLLTLFVLLALASCGTILNGPPYMVPVDSYPRGAPVYYRNAAVGITPCQVAMDGNCLELTVGGQVVEVDYSRNWLGTFGNACLLIPGCLVGLAVDFSTGAWRVPDSSGVVVRGVSVPGANARTTSGTPSRIIRSPDPSVSPYCVVEPCKDHKSDGWIYCAVHLAQALRSGPVTDDMRTRSAFCSMPGCNHLRSRGYTKCDTHRDPNAPPDVTEPQPVDETSTVPCIRTSCQNMRLKGYTLCRLHLNGAVLEGAREEQFLEPPR